MQTFIGNIEARLDEKGRIFVPASYRKILAESESKRIVDALGSGIKVVSEDEIAKQKKFRRSITLSIYGMRKWSKCAKCSMSGIRRINFFSCSLWLMQSS